MGMPGVFGCIREAKGEIVEHLGLAVGVERAVVAGLLKEFFRGVRHIGPIRRIGRMGLMLWRKPPRPSPRAAELDQVKKRMASRNFGGNIVIDNPQFDNKITLCRERSL